MKISKVDHTRAAVSRGEGRISGILYTDPSKEKSQNLSERLKNLQRKSRNLYAIFNQIKDKDEYRKYGYFIKSVNEVAKTLLKERNLSVEGMIKALRTKHENPDLINDVVTLYLRKSLKKECEGLKYILRAAFKNVSMDSIERNQAEAFVKLVIADYTKSDTNSKIIKAISNQNMLVQPDKSGGGCVLTINQQVSAKKRDEKAGFRAFLNGYANLDDDIRMDMLHRLRRIVVLYFATPQNGVYDTLPKCVENTNSNVWSDHEEGKKLNGTFVPIPSNEGIIGKNGKQDRVKLKEFNSELKKRIHNRNMLCYRYSVKAIESEKELFFEERDTNIFWIHHIEDAVERILAKADYSKLNKLELGYLQEKIWKDVLNFISIKYIAIGKAVFNYTLDDMFNSASDMNLGAIPSEAIEGFTSFDYEIIKANETLQREMSVQVAFAANNLARATVNIPEDSKKEDFLLWDKEDMAQYAKSQNQLGTIKAILQFFGGASTWSMDIFTDAYGREKADVELLYDLKTAIYALRNESFHFVTANINKGTWNQDVIMQMFKKDAAACVSGEKDKFYSNNLPMFYMESDLRKVLNHIYKKHVIRQSQVPAFNSVLVRKNFRDFLSKKLRCTPSFKDVETDNKWQSALYYLFKEIYYNDFLSCDEAHRLFFDALEQMVKSDEYKYDKKKEKAIDDFKCRCSELKALSLSEICQVIMTEYNYQNQGNMKVKNAKVNANNPDIFQHYKMLLLATLRNAFAIFIKKNEIYSFIIKPSYKELGEVEDFCKDWVSDKYNDLIDIVEKDANLQKWYVTSRFLNGRSLSLLSGTVRSYIQYVQDIERRAKQTGNTLYRSENQKAEYCKKIVQVLELSTKLSSIFTKEFEDYFDSTEDYAEYLSHYLDYGYDAKGESAVHYLQAFCNQGDVKYDIYMDEKNPRPNRNILMAKLYAPDSILDKVIDRVNDKDIEKHYELQKNIAGYMVKGVCDTKDEQRAVLEFGRIKNRVELRSVVEYAEIINELLGQLVNWSFMRERDLLYFQLGFHYTCLNSNKNLLEAYKRIDSKKGVIDGAILYQIAAMYINGINIYGMNKEGTDLEIKKAFSTGSKIGAFCAYSEYMLKDTDYSNKRNDTVYNAGLEVFENINEHDDITNIRNTIDHFKYYSGKAGSILSLYSEVFDRFFTYDMKYQKNVGNLLTNILLGHFVNARLEFGSGEKIVNRNKKKPCAFIGIAAGGLSSEDFTYKLNGGDICKIPAKDKTFLETVGRILYYPEKKDGLAFERTFKDKAFGKKNLSSGNGGGKGFSNRQNGKSKAEREESNRRLNEYKKKNTEKDDFGTVQWKQLEGLKFD